MKILIVAFIFIILFLLLSSNIFFPTVTENLLINPVSPVYQEIVITNSKNQNTIHILSNASNSLYMFMKNSESIYSPYYVNFSLNKSQSNFSIHSSSHIMNIMSTNPVVQSTTTTNNVVYPFLNSTPSINENTLNFTDSIIFQNKYVIAFDSDSGTSCIIQSISQKNDAQIVFPFLNFANDFIIFTNFVTASSFSFQLSGNQVSSSEQTPTPSEQTPTPSEQTIIYGETDYNRVSISLKNQPPYETRITFTNNMYIDGTNINFLSWIGSNAVISINSFEFSDLSMFSVFNFKSYQIDEYGTFSYISFDGTFQKQLRYPVGVSFPAKPLLYSLPQAPSESGDNSLLYNIDQIIIKSSTNLSCINIQVCQPYCSTSCVSPFSISNKALLFQSVLFDETTGEISPNPNSNRLMYFNLNTGGYFHIFDMLTFANSNECQFIGFGDSISNNENIVQLTQGSQPIATEDISSESIVPVETINPSINQLTQGSQPILTKDISSESIVPVETINPSINRLVCLDGIAFQNNNSIQITPQGNLLLQNGNEHTIIDLTKESSLNPPITLTNNITIDQTTITNTINSIQFSNDMSFQSNSFGLYGTSAGVKFAQFLTFFNNFSGTSISNISL